MKYILLLFAVLSITNSYAQNISEKEGRKVYSFAEKMPAPSYDINTYLAESIRYPDSAIAHNTEGRVIVKFIVNEDGFITNCQLVKGIGNGCDEEALRVIKNMPPWKPGCENGKAVAVAYTQPITFKLMEPDSSVQLVEVYKELDTMPASKYDISFYLAKNLHYPEKICGKGILGTVVVKFVVNNKGLICNPELVTRLSEDLDAEALRAISNMPPWSPGIKDKKAVNCWVSQPVTFSNDSSNSLQIQDKSDIYVAPTPKFDFLDYMVKNLRYPEKSRDAGIQGRVIVRFLISEDGSISNCEVLKGIAKDMDEEAMRIIRTMPYWNPCTKNGKPVSSHFTQPILFKLD